jgi:hypothetical protein
MKIVKVFKTNVQDQLAAKHIVLALQQSFAHYMINFDLGDCDRILRIESQREPIDESDIRLLVAACGYHCEPLVD